MSAVISPLRSQPQARPRPARIASRWKRTVVLSVLALTWPLAARAQVPAPPPTPLTDVTASSPTLVVPPNDLDYASRLALAHGVMLLKQHAEKDPMGWIIPPIQKVRITGYKDVPRKYRVIEVERPVYEYTDVVVFIPGPSPGEPPIKTMRKQPTKQIGTRTEKHIRWDPEGPLEMIDKQPIYEHVGDTSWHFSLIGDSAMALNAVRTAGLPEGDPVVQRMVENLFNYLETYGPPDQTWNLAWLTIAMAHTDGDQAEKWTEKLASRILDGQITDGPARGLWGPMCIHPRLISVLVRDYLAAEAELAKKVAKQKEKPTKQNQSAIHDAEGDRNRLKKYTDSWSRFALRFATVEFPLVWDDQMAEKVHFMGSTDFFYNQRSADMESTWVALHALAVCSELKRLPKESIRPTIPPSYRATSAKLGDAPKPPPPVISQLNATTVPPESSMAVLARAANALATLQQENGQWNECNFHQPVTDFDGFGKFLSVPADPASFPPLKSPVTAASAAQGIAALDCIGRAVGMEKLAKFQPKYVAGAKGHAATLQTYIKTVWPKPLARSAAMGPETCQVLLAAAHSLKLDVPEATASSAAEDELASLLIVAADPDGGWGSKFRRGFLPSSSRERYQALKDIPGRNWRHWRLDLPIELPKAHVSQWNVTLSDYNHSSALAYATAVAVYYLASRMKEPGQWLQDVMSEATLAEQRKGLNDVLLAPLKPKPAPVVAAKPSATPAKPGAPAKAPEKPMTKVEEAVPAITIKPADTTKKKDEAF
jgi:hypothetical protein